MFMGDITLNKDLEALDERAGEAGNDLESQVLAQTHAPLASPVSHTER